MPTAYFGTLTYSVVAGDTLYKIARDYNSTVDNIIIYNNITNPNLIYIGQSIIIPLSPPEAIIYTVKAGDTLYLIAKKYGTYVNNLIMFNYSIKPPYTIYPGQQLVVTASLR
jgi:LysM repeat protein